MASAVACAALAVVAFPWGVVTTPVVAAGACPHPFVPSRVGTTLRYAWTAGAASGELVLSLTGAITRGSGVELTWESAMSGAGEPVRGTFVRACSDIAAEEPWFGFPQPGGVEVGEPTWAWPSDLRRGRAFDGMFVVRALGRERAVERRHRVNGRETVHVRAGGFDAIRVDTEDRGERGGAPGRGSTWVAVGIGLVRSDESSATGRATYELVDVSVPAHR